MNRIYIFLLFTAISLSGFAQLGTKTLYHPQQSKYTPVPLGYKAVYINFLGRHGARHLTKDVKVSYAWRLIKIADSLNALTPEGKKLWQMVSNLDKVEEKGFASISQIGAEELQGIAKRLYANQKNVFLGNSTPILISTTKKGRTKESAEAFLSGLKAEKSSLTEAVKFNYADDDHLRFYDFSKTYNEFEEHGAWIKDYQKLAVTKKLSLINNRFATIFFTADFLKGLNAENKKSFIEDIYGFYTILGAIKNEIKAVNLSLADLNFAKYFSLADLTAIGILGDAEDFLKKGPGMNANGIQIRIAAPLLADFINTTDHYLKSDGPIALRFAHAETVAPFAAIMNIKGASEPAKDILSFNQVWQAEKVIPFSANIQWIFYKNESKKHYLVKFLLNEKEVAVNGLSTKTYPYYNWDLVRAFYLKKLKGLKVGLQDDMHHYLLNVK